jgi:hypothetical protein
VDTAVRHPEVVRLAQVERSGTDQAGLLHEGLEENGHLVVHVAVKWVCHRCHVVLAHPDLVVAVEAQRLAPGDKSLKLGGGWTEHHSSHISQRTAEVRQPRWPVSRREGTVGPLGATPEAAGRSCRPAGKSQATMASSELAGWSRPGVGPSHRAYDLAEEGRDSTGQGAG